MFEVEGAKKMKREIAVCSGAPVVIYSIYIKERAQVLSTERDPQRALMFHLPKVYPRGHFRRGFFHTSHPEHHQICIITEKKLFRRKCSADLVNSLVIKYFTIFLTKRV